MALAVKPRQHPVEQIQLSAISSHEFGTLTEPHRRELLVHCYRLLGSLQDAEDSVQETLLRAWRRRETFEGRAPLRAWLYKIATNLCLDALERRARRTLPVMRQNASNLDEPIPPELTEPIWLEPFPDALLPQKNMSPEVHVFAREHISLAFIVLLQQLPPRQRAVLILRDVLDWPASEVADLLGLTVSAVKSALFRARTTLATHQYSLEAEVVAPMLDEPLRTRLDRYVHAWETADVNEFVALLKADATFSMPPIPAWYQGRDTIRGLVAKTIFRGEAQGRWRLQPTRANGQLAFGVYRHEPTDKLYRAYGIQVVSLDGNEIAAVTTFRNPALVSWFNLPPDLSH